MLGAPCTHGRKREMQMSDRPKDVIEAAIRSAFTSYPKEDDPDWRSPALEQARRVRALGAGHPAGAGKGI